MSQREWLVSMTGSTPNKFGVSVVDGQPLIRKNSILLLGGVGEYSPSRRCGKPTTGKVFEADMLRNEEVGRALTTAEAAEMMGVKAATLRGWRAQRIGPPFVQYSPRCVRYAECDIRKYADERRVVPSVLSARTNA